MQKKGTFLLGAVLALAGLGCGAKPSEELCERAVENIRKLTGQARNEVGADPKAAVRSCRAQSDGETVECMAEARTSEELYRCGGAMADQLKAMEKKKIEGEGEVAAPPGGDKPAEEPATK
jgi:hypothetical protein